MLSSSVWDLLRPYMLKIQNEKWYSAKDIAGVYGKSHQYWSKLLKKGMIRSENTSAGRITTQSWLNDFFTIETWLDK